MYPVKNMINRPSVCVCTGYVMRQASRKEFCEHHLLTKKRIIKEPLISCHSESLLLRLPCNIASTFASLHFRLRIHQTFISNRNVRHNASATSRKSVARLPLPCQDIVACSLPLMCSELVARLAGAAKNCFGRTQ
jgi:hypothetical protein